MPINSKSGPRGQSYLLHSHDIALATQELPRFVADPLQRFVAVPLTSSLRLSYRVHPPMLRVSKLLSSVAAWRGRMDVYEVPRDVYTRPELQALVRMGCRPGHRIVWRGPHDWDVICRPFVTSAAEFSLRFLTRVGSDVSVPVPVRWIERPGSIRSNGWRVRRQIRQLALLEAEPSHADLALQCEQRSLKSALR
jgi:hypothetical protein